MEKRVISTQLQEEDYKIESSLRPQRLEDYIGQEKIKSNMKVYIEAAKARHTPVLYERKLIHVTMTFGVEEFGRNHTMESVIQEADRKLYLGKESGRNRVIY